MTDRSIIIAAISDELAPVFDRHLFGHRSRIILRMTLDRLEQAYGRSLVRSAVRLRHRLDRESYRAERQRQTGV